MSRHSPVIQIGFSGLQDPHACASTGNPVSILPVSLGTLDPWRLCLLPIRPQPPDLDFHLGEKVKNEHPLLCHFDPAATAPHFQHIQQMTGRKTTVSRTAAAFPTALQHGLLPPSSSLRTRLLALLLISVSFTF